MQGRLSLNAFLRSHPPGYLFAGNQTKPPVEPPVTPTKPGSRRDSAATPTKRVSFMPEQEKRTQEVDLDEEEEEEEVSE